MKKILLIALLLSVGFSQQKWNIKSMYDYNGLMYSPTSDKPYTGNVFSLDSLGTKKEEGKYRNGLKNGKWSYYTEIGNGKYEVTFKAGIYTTAVFTDSLGIDYTGSPITDEPEQDGIFLYQDDEGGEYDFSKFPKFFVTVKNGEPNGLATIWYENGQKSDEYNFKDGKWEGKHTSWYENGQKSEERTYKNGKQDGLYTKWYENGQKSSEGTYKDGKMISEKKWKEDGSVKE